MSEAEEQVRKRCVCGGSAKLPFCDGSHQSAKWSCKGEEAKTEILVAASPILYSYAERLAHFLGGQACHQSSQLSAKKLIRLIDIHVCRPAPHIQAEHVLNISIGVPLQLLVQAIPMHEAITYLEDDEPSLLWRSLKSKCKQEESWEAYPLKRDFTELPILFLSHAILDEAILMNPIAKLRDYFGLNIFVCADSLVAGGRWRDDIQIALDRSDLMLVAFSKHLRRSTFCAYEIGYAHGKGIKTIAISLDGTAPPEYLSHLQCIDLSRRQVLMPWYTQQDLLIFVTMELLEQIQLEPK